MDCRDAERFVQLRLDEEIDPADCMSLDRHLETCTLCRSRGEQERFFKSALRAKLEECMTAPQGRPPADLRGRILSQARAEDHRRSFPLGRLIGAGLAMSAIGALSWTAGNDETSMLEETVARHSSNLPPEVRARSLDEDPEDPEVHRFLERNLRYPVAVPHLGRSDLPVRLIGARLSNISDRDAAYMMYDHRGAKVSLFAVPAPNRTLESAKGFERRAVGGRVLLVGQRRGYNVVSWRDRDLMYSLVSDVDPGELVQLVSSTGAR